LARGRGLSSDASTQQTTIPGETLAGLVVFEHFYSVWDGAHDLQGDTVDSAGRPRVDCARPGRCGVDQWFLDKQFVSQEPYDARPGGVLLTTKKAGNTTISASATTLSGRVVKASVPFNITAATAADWSKGDDRYNNSVAIDFSKFLGPNTGMQMSGPCGLPISFNVPTDSSCRNCHDESLARGYSGSDAAGLSIRFIPHLGYVGRRQARCRVQAALDRTEAAGSGRSHSVGDEPAGGGASRHGLGHGRCARALSSRES
jgi:hypothetical protein